MLAGHLVVGGAVYRSDVVARVGLPHAWVAAQPERGWAATEEEEPTQLHKAPEYCRADGDALSETVPTCCHRTLRSHQRLEAKRCASSQSRAYAALSEVLSL